VTGNIRSGVDLFGVSGDPNVVNTSSGDAVAGDVLVGKKAWVDGSEVTGTAPPAAVAKTGQTTCYNSSGNSISCAGTGQDGELQPGVAWPSPRFTDNGDGTVTDNLTGLIWLEDASCADLAGTDSNGSGDWSTALSASAALADGTCGLSDGSSAGDWRLPSRFELESLLDLEYYGPALSNAAGTAQWSEGDAFVGVQSTYYWSSTSLANYPQYAWYVYLGNGNVSYRDKTNSHYVWPVRGGR
jgi:hypothetical protein